MRAVRREAGWFIERNDTARNEQYPSWSIQAIAHEPVLEARTNDDGLFVGDEGRLVLEDPVPLARLHVAAALRGEDRSVLPTPVGDRRSPEGGV